MSESLFMFVLSGFSHKSLGITCGKLSYFPGSQRKIHGVALLQLNQTSECKMFIIYQLT